MPRKPKTAQPEAKPAETPSAEPRGTKTAAIQAALNAHRGKKPKEIAELLRAEGWDVKPQSVSVIKSTLKAKRAAPAAAKKVAPATPKAADAISLDALKKAKELAAQLGGISKAKAAIAALAELLD